jgi:hypothetical protein
LLAHLNLTCGSGGRLSQKSKEGKVFSGEGKTSVRAFLTMISRSNLWTLLLHPTVIGFKKLEKTGQKYFERYWRLVSLN